MHLNRKIVFLIAGITLIVIALIFKIELPSENDIDDLPFAMRSHIMVNNQIYWSSAYPPDFIFYTGNFDIIGEVEEKVDDTPKKDFQAHGIEKGSPIYYDSQIPYLVYVKTVSAPYRYATVEASQEYIYHDNIVYVSLSSLCGWDYDSYVRDYIPIYGDDIAVIGVPENTIYIGETNFIGYNMFVFAELETNEYNHSVPVYQDGNNPNILYAGDCNTTVDYLKIYVAKIE